MSLQALIDNGTIEPIPVNIDDIDAILEMVSKDLHAAKIYNPDKTRQNSV